MSTRTSGTCSRCTIFDIAQLFPCRRDRTGCDTSRRIGGLISLVFQQVSASDQMKDTSDMTSSSRIGSIGR